MSSGKKGRSKRRPSTRRQSISSPQSPPDPIFLKPCKNLLNQITAMDDCKDFRKLISTHNTLYSAYKKINPRPISFKTIHTRLHERPCHYNSYQQFNKDVKKIFAQEQRLKSYKGSDKSVVQQRMLKAKRVQNYWETLTAPYTQYGFDKIISAQNRTSSDEREEVNQNRNNRNNSNKHEDDEENDDDTKQSDNINRSNSSPMKRSNKKKKKHESKKQKQNQRVLSNIKKRHKRGEESPLQSPNKRRRLNDQSPERISKDKSNQFDTDQDDDRKQQTDEDEDNLFEKRKKTEYVVNDYNEDEDEMKGSQIQYSHRNHNRNSNGNNDVFDDDDDEDLEQDDDDEDDDFYDDTHDTPFTPFAHKSRIFHQVIGGNDLFNGLPQSDPTHKIKKKLSFEGGGGGDDGGSITDIDTNYGYRKPVLHTFEIKYLNNNALEPKRVDFEARRMDKAVQKFREIHKNCKILTVKLRPDAFAH